MLPDYVVISSGDTGPWIWRCWGDGECSGWVGLDLSSPAAALAEALRHVHEFHQEATS